MEIKCDFSFRLGHIEISKHEESSCAIGKHQYVEKNDNGEHFIDILLQYITFYTHIRA